MQPHITALRVRNTLATLEELFYECTATTTTNPGPNHALMIVHRTKQFTSKCLYIVFEGASRTLLALCAHTHPFWLHRLDHLGLASWFFLWRCVWYRPDIDKERRKDCAKKKKRGHFCYVRAFRFVCSVRTILMHRRSTQQDFEHIPYFRYSLSMCLCLGPNVLGSRYSVRFSLEWNLPAGIVRH